MIIEITFGILAIVLSICTDMIIFYNVSGVCEQKSDKIFLLIASIFLIIICLIVPSQLVSNIFITIIEIIIIFIYFSYIKKQNKKLILGSCLIFGLLDLSLIFMETIFDTIFPSSYILHMDNFFDLLMNSIVLYPIYKYKLTIRKIITDSNSQIFVGILAYLYITGDILNYFILIDNEPTELVIISVSLLVLQSIFAFLMYLCIIHIQKNLITEQDQKQQKLKLKLVLSKQKSIETQNKQLQEYTNYLDKNEDELRRFKHDYQNMLNGLKISAQEGNTKAVIEQLDKYTNSQFDQKALRKYKDVNHIHDQNLKSIAIAKLTKLYSLNINYSFGCDKDIYQIPKSVDILDLVRIIGITFDNAIEESQSLIKETGKQDPARVDAMYYQEDGDFEFEIRNRIRNRNFDTDKISQKNYTTKKNHMGLGLSNVQQIAHKYERAMMINYTVDKGWFTFDLTILPDEKSGDNN